MIKCSTKNCKNSNALFTSKRATPESHNRSQGIKPFDLNVRSVLAMRLLGKGMKAKAETGKSRRTCSMTTGLMTTCSMTTEV